MKYVLIKLNKSWLDEFHVSSFSIITEEEWKKFQDDVYESKSYPFECGFGTNHSIIFENASEVMSSIVTSKEISENDVEVIKRVIGISFGLIDIFEIWDRV